MDREEAVNAYLGIAPTPSPTSPKAKSRDAAIEEFFAQPDTESIPGPSLRAAPGFGSRILERAGVPTTIQGWKEHYIRGPLGVVMSPFAAAGEAVDTAAEALGRQRPVAPGISTPGGTPSMSLGDTVEQALMQAPISPVLRAIRSRLGGAGVPIAAPPAAPPRPPLALPPVTRGERLPVDAEGQVIRRGYEVPRALPGGTAGELPPHINWETPAPPPKALLPGVPRRKGAIIAGEGEVPVRPAQEPTAAPERTPSGRPVIPESQVEKTFGIEMEPGAKFEKTAIGEQGLVPGLEKRALVKRAIRPETKQSVLEESPLFGQAKAARERASEAGQAEIVDPQRAAVQEWLSDQLGSQGQMALAKAKSAGSIPPATKKQLESLGLTPQEAWDVSHAEVPKASTVEKIVGLSSGQKAIPPTPGPTAKPFLRAEGFEHGQPNLGDPDDVYQAVAGMGKVKVLEQDAGELADMPATLKSKNGLTLDQMAETLADQYPGLGDRGTIKEQLADTLRRYSALKQDKARKALTPEMGAMFTDLKMTKPPHDIPVTEAEWTMMDLGKRRAALEFFRDTLTDESGLLRLSMLEGPGKALSKVKDDLQALLAPASRGEKASLMAGIMRPNLAELARKTETAHALLRKSERWMEGLTDEQKLRFIDGIESGRIPREGSTAEALRTLLDGRRTAVQNLGTGKLEHFIEDYFPHLWKDPGQAADAFAQAYGRRPLGGTGAFLKQRTIPTVKEGVALGLEPVTTNPVTATLLKLREMDRYVMAQNILREMKDTGLARLVSYEERAPGGWTRINDKIARAGSSGQYWAPEPAARLLNNHLTPGLQGNALFDAYRGLGNMLNQMQLGFSAFHLGFVSMDVMQSKIALGLQQLAAGRPIAAAKSVLSAPIAPVTSVLKGSKVLREYFSPGSQGAEMAAVVDQLIKAGGRARMDPFYGGSAGDQFLKALRGGKYGTASLKAWPAFMETLSKPIMQEYVPRAKLGVFMDLAQHELSKLAPNAPRAEVVRVLGRAWDSVDNRLGQMTYDNLFWNRTLKDALMASVRSVGWNMGTLREIGGGLGDTVIQMKRAARGEGFEMTPRMAYTATLPFTTAVLGAMIGYLYTGKGPESLKDYFYPRTGRQRKDGSDDRVSLPTYMKDVVAYAQHPWTTVKHKLSPTLSLMSEMLENQDYYGATIRNQDDPIVRQMVDSVDHILGSAESFSIRGFQQQRKTGASVAESLPGFIGITPAPAAMTRSAEQQAAIERRMNRQGLAKKRKQDATDPGPLRSIEDRLRDAGYLR